MAMREAVAVDFMGVGGGGVGGSSCPPDGSGSEERVRLVRPIPSGGGQARRSPAPEGGHPFASQGGLHGPRQHAWNRVPVAGRFQADEDNTSKAMMSPKRERESTDGPLNAHPAPLSQWDKSDSAGNASRYDAFLHREQVRKVAAMYAGHQQASRGMQNAGARTSPFRDEVLRAAQPGSEHVATQPQPPSNQGGFGSPAPFYGRARQPSGAENGAAASTGKRPPIQQHAFQAGNAHGLARPAGPRKQPRTAQLTIFYAGMVNVYDDVPYDKAQAIMLLAGSGNTWSSNYMNPPASGAPARPSVPMAVPQSTASTPGSPAPQAPTTSAAAPPRPVVPGVVFSNVRAAPIQNVELPQARKASLARFLEKRKDRARKVPAKEDGEASPSRDRSPGPSVGKPATRSPSPSQAASGGTAATVQDHRSSPGGPRHQAGASSCSEPGSPTRPPGTPPRQSVSEERSNGTPKRRDYELEQNANNKRARSGRSSPRRLGGQSPADHNMDDDSSSL